MAGNYVNVLMDMIETSLLNNFYKKTAKIPAIRLRFIDWAFFYLNKQWRLSQKMFYNFARNAVKNLKYLNLLKLINFLEVCITLNWQTLSTTVISKPTDPHIHLNPEILSPWKYD